LSQFIQPEGSRHILGLGLLAYGVIGVIGARAVSGERRYRWGALAVDLLAIVLGCLTVTRQPGETGNLQLICGILVVGGVALLVRAYVMWQRGPRAGGA
jgi:uncharacterized membrane protein HdeD (DUF308 family)